MSPSRSAEELLNKTNRLWTETKSSPYCRLLRLALMRGLAHSFHALRSEAMAAEHAPLANDLARRETILLDRFTELPICDLELNQIFEPNHPKKKTASGDSATTTPAELFSVIEESKLNRQDRRWEAELAAEAFRMKWNFWIFESWIEVPSVESWAKTFSDKLWPNAIILYVESDGFNKTPALWRGRWLLLVDPSVSSPEILEKRLHPEFSKIPRPTETRWSVLKGR